MRLRSRAVVVDPEFVGGRRKDQPQPRHNFGAHTASTFPSRSSRHRRIASLACVICRSPSRRPLPCPGQVIGTLRHRLGQLRTRRGRRSRQRTAPKTISSIWACTLGGRVAPLVCGLELEARAAHPSRGMSIWRRCVASSFSAPPPSGVPRASMKARHQALFSSARDPWRPIRRHAPKRWRSWHRSEWPARDCFRPEQPHG